MKNIHTGHIMLDGILQGNNPSGVGIGPGDSDSAVILYSYRATAIINAAMILPYFKV